MSYRRRTELISVAPWGQDVECEGRLIMNKCQQRGMLEKVENTDYTFWTNPINTSPSHPCVLLGRPTNISWLLLCEFVMRLVDQALHPQTDTHKILVTSDLHSSTLTLHGHEKTETQNNYDDFLQSSICHQLSRGKKICSCFKLVFPT